MDTRRNVMLRLPGDVHERATIRAKHESRSLANWIQRQIEAGLGPDTDVEADTATPPVMRPRRPTTREVAAATGTTVAADLTPSREDATGGRCAKCQCTDGTMANGYPCTAICFCPPHVARDAKKAKATP